MAFSRRTTPLQVIAMDLLLTFDTESNDHRDTVAALDGMEPLRAAACVLYMVVLHGDGDPDGLYRRADDLLNALEARL